MAYELRTRALVDTFALLPYQKNDGSPEGLAAEKEQKTISEAIKASGEIWSRQMERLTEILKETSPDKLQIAAWNMAVADLRDGLATSLGNALRDIKTPTPRAREFLTVAQVEDLKFCQALGLAQEAAASRDYIATYRKLLDEKIQALDAKWTKIMDVHKSFNGDEKSAIADVEAVHREAAEAIANQQQEQNSKILEAISNLGELTDVPEMIPDWWSLPFKLLTINAERLFQMVDKRGARVLTYQAYFRQELGTVLPMFKEFRDDAEEFSKQYHYRKILEACERAKKVLHELKSNDLTSIGLRAEADAFAGSPITALEKMAANAKEVWDKFVEKNQYKFFGPVGPEIAKAILSSEEWDEAYRKLMSSNLAELLEKWLNQTRSYFEIEVSGMNTNTRDALKAVSELSIQRLIDAQVAAKNAVSLDKLYDDVVKARKEAEQKLLSM
jgi:hypothetical protein